MFSRIKLPLTILTIISIGYLLLFEKVDDIDVVSLITEFIMTCTVFFLLALLSDKDNQSEVFSTIRLGFLLIFTSLVSDTFDEVVEISYLVVILLEDVLEVIGFFILLVGVNDWLKTLKSQKKSLELLAHTDSLTGAYIRRYFLDMVKLARQENKQPKGFAILLFDIDHFKKINDNYGHNAGDQALIEFTSLLKQLTREDDIFARWGGEEFILFLKNTQLNDALVRANKIKDKIEQLVVHYQQQQFSYTASIGVVHCCDTTTSIDSLISQADKQLYLAKENGRNLVMPAITTES